MDWVQIREKDLPPRELLDLVIQVIEVARPRGIKVLVNERADVAVAAGADGVHLPSRAIAPVEFRRLGIRLIGVSCHDQAELTAAVSGGADFAVLGPVFAPKSKRSFQSPLGLEEFGRLASNHPGFPVLALGGVTDRYSSACESVGAAGIAGISLFRANC